LDPTTPFLVLCLLAILRPPPRSPLFPYTTLFRSIVKDVVGVPEVEGDVVCRHHAVREGGGHHLRLGAHQQRMLELARRAHVRGVDRKSTRLNSSHGSISYAVFCLKKKKQASDTPT